MNSNSQADIDGAAHALTSLGRPHGRAPGPDDAAAKEPGDDQSRPAEPPASQPKSSSSELASSKVRPLFKKKLNIFAVAANPSIDSIADAAGGDVIEEGKGSGRAGDGASPTAQVNTSLSETPFESGSMVGKAAEAGGAAGAASTAHTGKGPSESESMAGKGNDGSAAASGKTAGSGAVKRPGGSAEGDRKKKSKKPPPSREKWKPGDPVLPEGKRLAIIVPSSFRFPCFYYPPGEEVTASAFTDAMANAKPNEIEMIKTCIRELKCMCPNERVRRTGNGGTIGKVPSELFFQRSERGDLTDEVKRHHLALAVFVGHLAKALGIEPDEVQDKIFLLTCLQMTEFARFSAQQNQGLQEEQRNLEAVFAECPIYVLFGTSAKITFDKHSEIIDGALPRGALTYPPPQIARPAAYPKNQAILIGMLWKEIGVPGDGPVFLNGGTPKETLKEILGRAYPEGKQSNLFLLGKYAHVATRCYDGDQMCHGDHDEPTHWTYDFATWLGNEERSQASHYGPLSSFAFIKNDDFDRSTEYIVYQIGWFSAFEMKPPPFGRVYFTHEKRDNKGPRMIDLWLCETWDEEVSYSNRNVPTRDEIKAWGPPPKLRKDEDPCPSRTLKELCKLVSRKEMTTYTNDKQVFRVDFIFSTRKSAFVPLAVMGVPCHTDWAAERPPAEVHKEWALATEPPS